MTYLWVGRSPEVYNSVGIAFVADAGLDLCSEKGKTREGVFLVGRRSWMGGGGGLKKRVDVKALRLDMVLVYYLGKIGALMMKMYRVSG